MVTLVIWLEVTKASREEYQEHFDLQVKDVVKQIKSRMTAYQLILRGAQGLFDASESVSRDEFRDYVNSLKIKTNYSGIQGVGFSLIIPPEQKQSHIASIKADGYPEYEIKPKGERNLYTSIIYLEPFDRRNRRAFGYDMYSNKTRRAAMERARDTGTPAMTGKVRLLQEDGQNEQAGFLIYLPVYKQDSPIDTIQNRRTNIIGWVYSPFRINNFMASLQGLHLNHLDIELFDGTQPAQSSVMYDSVRQKNAAIADRSNKKSKRLQSSHQIKTAGHTWTIKFSTLPTFYHGVEVFESWLILFIGFAVSILSALILRLLMGQRDKEVKQKQLQHIAYFDLLTNLPNRTLLADRLSQAMAQCKRQNDFIAVLFLDLDGFKAVNDKYGHHKGDELLVIIAEKMNAELRAGDTLARLGGDEFVIILTNLNSVEACEPVLERLLHAAAEPIVLTDQAVNVSASIGVTFYPKDIVDADQLLRHADQAMYIAKQSGKNRYHIFDIAYDDAIKMQREYIGAIRNGLYNQEFVLYYQPKVNMKTGIVIGVEALIRWQHPERGLLQPGDFLPLIENHLVSIELGDWVLATAMEQLSKWHESKSDHPISISVNIAPLQLQRDDFVDKLKALLAAHPDIAPHYLELEVLETNALDDVEHVSAIMKRCLALGVNFAIDDFGTGYSSLTYLRRLPSNLVKIDKSFVRAMLSNPDDLAIVESVIGLAKSFNRDVIAEGVETIEHGNALLLLGCQLAQGYGIAKPMPAADIPSWISQWKPNDTWQM